MEKGKGSSAKLVFVDGVFPTDVGAQLAELKRQHDEHVNHDGGEEEEFKVMAIVAKNQRLETLPADLPYLPALAAHVRELDLSLNSLTQLPEALSCLQRLEYLNLGHNAFARVPPLVLTTPSPSCLRHLFLGGNRLTSLPAELTRLTRLENLSLGHNQFDAVPPVVYELKSLLSLSLNHNVIASIQASSDRGHHLFARLTRLRTLDLSHNALTELALDVPPSLTSLDVSSNSLLTALTLRPSQSPVAGDEKRRLKRLNVGWCRLTGLPPTLAAFDRMTSIDYANNPWDDEHCYLRTNPLSSAVLTWLQVRTRQLPAVGAPMSLAHRYSLWDGRLSDGEECTIKVYADDTPAEVIAHEFSVLRLMYADRADSPLLGICFKPDRLPCLVLQKCLRSLATHVKTQQLSIEQRAQLAYHATEAVDALISSVDEANPHGSAEEQANERASRLSLLYRDIQLSENWIVLVDGRPMLCGSALPTRESRGGTPAIILSPELRRHELRLQRRRLERQPHEGQNPLDALLLSVAADDHHNTNPWWTLVPLPTSSSASPQLVYAVGLLLHTIFAAAAAEQTNAVEERRRPKRVPIELPLVVRQLLEWTWEWEKAAPVRKLQQPQPQPIIERGGRRPALQDVMWLCFWLGHERTRIDDNHGLALRDFSPQLVHDMERDGDEEKKLEAEGENEDEVSLDDETRDSLLALFAETQKRINERAMTLRCVKKEQKREQYWQVSHTDLYSDDDDDSEDDDAADDDDHDRTNAGGQGGLLQLQAMLTNLTNSFRDMSATNHSRE